MKEAMRALAILMLVTSCAGDLLGDAEPDVQAPTSPDGDGCGGGGGGLPTRACGTVCTCCVGCDVTNGTCMSLGPYFALGVGECYGSSPGTLTMVVDGVATVSTLTGAVADDSAVNVSASLQAGSFAMLIPAQLGTFDCAAGGAAWFVYSDGVTESWNRPTSPRAACSVTLATVGAIGERIDGTFAVSFVGANSHELTAGSFSVVRRAYD